MKKPVVLLLSHGLALGVGWLAFRGLPVTAAGPGNNGAQRTARSSRSTDGEEGRRLLAEMRQGWNTTAKAADWQAAKALPSGKSAADFDRSYAKQEAALVADIWQRSLKVVLPADPAAALTKLVSELKGGREFLDTAAFAIAWLQADPVAALRFLETCDRLGHSERMIQAMEPWIAKTGATQVAALVEKMPASKLYLATSLMKVTAAHEPTGLDAMLDLLEGTVPRQSLLRAAIHDLPEAQRPAVLTWIHTSLKGKEAGSAVMGLALGIEDPARAKTLMNEAMQWLDPNAMAYLKSVPDFREIMFRGVGPDSPMEERIEAKLAGPVEGKTADERRENAWKSLIFEDVTTWLHTNQLADTVQTGRMSATELWQEAASSFPHYDKAEQEEMLRTIFNRVAVSDPAGALKMLAQQGLGDQAGAWVLTAIRGRDIEKVTALVAQLPQETIRQNLVAFDRQYSYTVGDQAEQNGPYWTTWLRQQPAGLSKDLKLHYTARHYFQTGNPTLGTELKAMVQDPTVKAWPKL
jgi:hypothetical protein